MPSWEDLAESLTDVLGEPSGAEGQTSRCPADGPTVLGFGPASCGQPCHLPSGRGSWKPGTSQGDPDPTLDV